MDAVMKPRDEENMVDRLNFRYTAWLLMGSSILLASPAFLGSNSIQCWTPAQFTGGWSEYTHDYCWVENTYWLAFGDKIPEKIVDRDSKMLNYYQVCPRD